MPPTRSSTRPRWTRVDRADPAGAIVRPRLGATAWSTRRIGNVSIGGATWRLHAVRAGLVDDWHIFLHPILVGGGTAVFPDDVRVDLELVDERRFAGGVVYLHHRSLGRGAELHLTGLEHSANFSASNAMNRPSASAHRRSPAWSVARAQILRPSTSVEPALHHEGNPQRRGRAVVDAQVGGHAGHARQGLRGAQALVERGGHVPAVDTSGRALVRHAERDLGDRPVRFGAQLDGRRQRVGQADERAVVEHGEAFGSSPATGRPLAKPSYSRSRVREVRRRTLDGRSPRAGRWPRRAPQRSRWSTPGRR